MNKASERVELKELMKQRKPTALPKLKDKINFIYNQEIMSLIGNGK